MLARRQCDEDRLYASERSRLPGDSCLDVCDKPIVSKFPQETTRLVTLLVVLILQSAELRLECQTATSTVISKDASAQSLQTGDPQV